MLIVRGGESRETYQVIAELQGTECCDEHHQREVKARVLEPFYERVRHDCTLSTLRLQVCWVGEENKKGRGSGPRERLAPHGGMNEITPLPGGMHDL